VPLLSLAPGLVPEEGGVALSLALGAGGPLPRWLAPPSRADGDASDPSLPRLACAFVGAEGGAATLVPALATGPSTLRCDAPPRRPGAARVELRLRASRDGAASEQRLSPASASLALEVYPTAVVEAVEPRALPAGALAGGAALVVRGAGLPPTPSLLCTFEALALSGASAHTRATLLRAPAAWINGSAASCAAPPRLAAGAWAVGLAAFGRPLARDAEARRVEASGALLRSSLVLHVRGGLAIAGPPSPPSAPADGASRVTLRLSPEAAREG
jgi:hypothetical protein